MRKLYRSQRDKKLFGVCGGLAEMLNVDSTLLRIVLVVTACFSWGALIPLYFIAALVIPKEPTFDAPLTGTWNGYGTAAPRHGGKDSYSPPYGGYGQTTYAGAANPHGADTGAGLDHMMKDIESKAMWNEIQELKAKLAKYEKGDV